MERTSYRTNPSSSFMSLWGVSGIYVCLLFAAYATATGTLHVINKYQGFDQRQQKQFRLTVTVELNILHEYFTRFQAAQHTVI